MDDFSYSGSLNNWQVEIFNPYKSNTINYSGSVYNLGASYQEPHETNTIKYSGSLYNWKSKLFESYDILSLSAHPIIIKYIINFFITKIYY